MKKIILISLLLISVLNASIFKNVRDRYKDIDSFKLQNGMQVYLLSDKQAKNVSISLHVRVGTDIENKKTYGLTHLVEHIVFRDQRVPHHDYLDYFKESGATFVNAYTKRYETEFVMDVLRDKAYKITEELSTMVFDKNITNDDLKIEKSALQTEIGRSKWYYPIFYKVKKFFNVIEPPKRQSVYRDDFKLSKLKELPPFYIAQKNNQKFTLDDVLKHYRAYYYPANMTLEIVGNFDSGKMKNLIKQTFGKIDKKGGKTTKLPPRDAKLSHKQYEFYKVYKEDKNRGYIGYKYTENSYKTYQIMNAYMDNLATRLQQELRNKRGDVYTINSDYFSQRGASIELITFDGLHKNFRNNKKFIKDFMKKDIKNLDNITIKKALRESFKNYKSLEHDASSLLYLVHNIRYLKDELNTSKNPYEIFNSITYDEFKDTVRKICKKENLYKVIYEDYYFFPYEGIVLSFILLFLFIYAVIFYLKRKAKKVLKKHNIVYDKREIVLSRRVGNRIYWVIGIFLTIFFSSTVSKWIQYYMYKLLFGTPYYINSLELPYVYISIGFSFFIDLIFFLFFYYMIFLRRYYARVDVTKDMIFVIGTLTVCIYKKDIKSLKVVPWSLKKYKKILGSSVLFWKPLVEIELKNGKSFYLRAKNAQHLKEDLEKAI